MNETGLEEHSGGKPLRFQRRLLEWCPWVPNSLGLLKSKARGLAGRGPPGRGAGWGCRAAVGQECPCVSGKPRGVVRGRRWPGSCEDNESVVGIKWYWRARADLGFVWCGLFALKYKGQGLVFILFFYGRPCHQLVWRLGASHSVSLFL